MQRNTKDLLDPDKRKTHRGQYDAPPPSGDSAWTQLQEQVDTKIHSESIPMTEKLGKQKALESVTQSIDKATMQ